MGKPANAETRSRSVARCILIALLVANSEAGAASFNWDTAPGAVGTGDGQITGGDGEWSVLAPNWTIDGGVTNGAWANETTPHNAIFGGAGGVVTVAGDVTANSLTFDTAGYIIQGGRITLAGSNPTIIANSSVRIDAPIGGSNGLVKSGTAALTLTGANTYSGGTSLVSGTLVLNHPDALGSGRVVIAGGAIDSTASGVVLAANPQSWTGNFSFTGTENLHLGIGPVTLNGNRTVRVDAKNLTVGGVISGTDYGVTKTGGGILTLSGMNDYSGPTSIARGTISASIIGNAGEPGNLGSGDTINLGEFDGRGILNYTGLGETSDRKIVFKWDGGEIHSNGITLLHFSSDLRVQSGLFPVLTFAGDGNGQIDGLISSTSIGHSIEKRGGGIWHITGNLGETRNVNVRSGTLILSGQNKAYGGYVVEGGARLELRGGSSNTSPVTVRVGGILSGQGSTTGDLLMEAYSAILLDPGQPTDSLKVGDVTIWAGTATIAFTQPPADGSYQVLRTTSSFTLPRLVGARGGFTVDATDPKDQKVVANVSVAKRTWSGLGSTWQAGSGDSNQGFGWKEGDRLFFAGDSVVFEEPVVTGGVNIIGPVAPASVTISNHTKPYTFTGGGVIIGSTSVIKTGDGEATFKGRNFYTGGTHLQRGTLIADGTDPFGSGEITLGQPGGTPTAAALRLSGSAGLSAPITVSPLQNGSMVIGTTGESTDGKSSKISGMVTLHSRTTFDAVPAASLRLSGRITGDVGELTVSGGGRTTLTSTETDFSGDIRVTGAGTILQVSEATDSETIPDSSSITLESDSILQLASATGPETIDGLHGGGSVRTHPVLALGSLLRVGSAHGDGKFAGRLLNGITPLSLEKIGSGVQVISGLDNSYTGPTTVTDGALLLIGSISGTSELRLTGGVLRLRRSDAISDSARVMLSGGTLDTGGFSEGDSMTNGLGALTVTADSTIDFGIGDSSHLLFAALRSHIPGTKLSLENWTGTPYNAGMGDRLMFTGNNTARVAFLTAFSQSDISFNGVPGYAAIQYDEAHFEIVAIPEPRVGSLVIGASLLGLISSRRSRLNRSRGLRQAAPVVR